ncbi:MAG TPA: EamA family transporter [Patescibacteria group bacterium]|nr:EamA family transporter [Patescibacteria group bacterium]
MGWIFLALLGPFFHGWANVLDNVLTNQRVQNVFSLIVFTSFFNFFFLPLVWLFDKPSWPDVWVFPVFALLGLVNILYSYPYYRALQEEDTSVVAALFALGKIFVPILAFLFVGERLEPLQYVGFFVIVAASVALSLRSWSDLHLNAALGFMLLVSFFLAWEAVGFKFLFEHGVGWGTAVAGQSVFAIAWVLLLLVVPGIRRGMTESWRSFRPAAPFFVVEEFLTFAGSAASTYAFFLVPITFVTSVGSFQPFFVLFYAIVFRKKLSGFFKEAIDRTSLVRKLFFFFVMFAGIVLMAVSGG